jgi:hypothetical protein
MVGALSARRRFIRRIIIIVMDEPMFGRNIEDR